ncbi:hypothetical protein BaRGS_00007266, partial [Batillaria attramentaria]
MKGNAEILPNYQSRLACSSGCVSPNYLACLSAWPLPTTVMLMAGLHPTLLTSVSLASLFQSPATETRSLLSLAETRVSRVETDCIPTPVRECNAL